MTSSYEYLNRGILSLVPSGPTHSGVSTVPGIGNHVDQVETKGWVEDRGDFRSGEVGVPAMPSRNGKTGGV